MHMLIGDKHAGYAPEQATERRRAQPGDELRELGKSLNFAYFYALTPGDVSDGLLHIIDCTEYRDVTNETEPLLLSSPEGD